MRAQRLTIAVLLVSTAVAGGQQQPLQPPSFRSRISIVPVDVRVLDRGNKPIRDLRESDFTVLEDGMPQKIVHFSFQALEPIALAAGTRLAFRKPLSESITPQNRRIFLILLGRGRHDGPVRGIQGAMRFVREHLLPQDQVAILAYNRATDFTTDHKAVLATLDRFKEKHTSVEAMLGQRFSGLGARYGGSDTPKNIQSEIDAIFRGPGALPSRSVDATRAPADDRLEDRRRRDRDTLERAELASERIRSGAGTAFDRMLVDEASMIPEGLDRYVERSFETQGDLGNLDAGIRYLRLLDGEKHLVFISPNGLFLPALEHAHSIAARANDARVTIDIVHATGTPPAQVLDSSGRVVMAPPFLQTFETSSSRDMAALTGGQMTTTKTGSAFFKRLDETSRAQYLLGYVPANTNWDGRYRRIEVRVNRKNARVLYRHGYVGREDPGPLDRERYLMYTRVTNAANLARPLDDLKLEVGEPTVSDDRTLLTVDVRIRPEGVRMTQVDGAYVAKFEAVSFCGDAMRRVVGELWHTVEFKLDEARYQTFLREGATFSLRMRLTGEPRFLKTILYDYTSDLVGSAVLQLKPPALKR